ncbi:MAG: acyl-CoA dehydrogenase family protein [bacterium]
MNFELSEELKILRETTRKFVQKELVPLTHEIDETGRIPDKALARMKELGYFGITVPEEYGGMGLSVMGHLVIQEELARGAHGCFNAMISGNNGIGALGILFDGTEEQKKKYLPALARGEKVAAFALTEPGAGSDAAAIETTAVRDGDNFVINGIKHFITRGDIADVFTVLALTDRNLRSKGGITAFIVEKGTPGFSLGCIHKSMGSDVVKQCELIFEDCVVPVSNVIGEVGQGFKTAMRVLDEGRLSYGARSLGTAEYLLELSINHSRQRVQFGKPIGKNQAIQWMLVDMATEIHALRSMLYQTAWKKEQGAKVTKECSMVKLFATEMVGRVADRALQIHGGSGYMSEFPIERIYRDVRVWRIVEGTSEIQRVIIARELLKD